MNNNNTHAISFIFFGIALLTPWNTWIQLNEYLESRLLLTPFSKSFESIVSVTYQFTNLCVLIVLLTLRLYRVRLQESKRLVLGLWLLLMIFMSGLLLIFSDIRGVKLFNYFLLLVALSAVSGSLLTSFIGLASSFPPASMTYLSVGQGVAALLPSISQYISSSSPGSGANAALCFLESIIVGLISFYAYNRLLNLQQNDSRNYEELISEEGDSDAILVVFKNIYFPAISVFLNLLITLSLFPAITASVEDVHFPRLVLLHFIVYNGFDLIGKFTTLKLSLGPRPVFLLTLGRIAFIPLILMCNITLLDKPQRAVVFGTSSFLMILAFFGFSNGYLTAISFVNSSALITAPSPNAYEIAGDLMQFFLTVGLTLGSACTFLLQKLA